METQSRRERKKLETRRALIQAARALVEQHGVDGVTVEEIADAAGFTGRTFFNHFSCKEEAVVAYDPVTLARLGDELRARPPDEGPAEALLAVLTSGIDSEGIVQRSLFRHQLVTRDPKLLPSYLAAMDQVESVLTLALADRAGIDPKSDPRLQMLVSGVLATTRAGVNWWSESDRSRPLLSVLAEAFDLMSPTPTTGA